MVSVVLLAKVLGTSYAVAKELQRYLVEVQKAKNLSNRSYRKVRKGR